MNADLIELLTDIDALIEETLTQHVYEEHDVIPKDDGYRTMQKRIEEMLTRLKV